MSAITHIELRAGGATWRIACSLKRAPSNIRKDVVVNSTEGMLSPGELADGSMPRSYSQGSVYNPRATRAGKNISIPITFYSEDQATLVADWLAFEDFLNRNKRVTLEIFGMPKVYNCIVENWPVDDTRYNSAISCTLLLTALEAV